MCVCVCFMHEYVFKVLRIKEIIVPPILICSFGCTSICLLIRIFNQTEIELTLHLQTNVFLAILIYKLYQSAIRFLFLLRTSSSVHLVMDVHNKDQSGPLLAVCGCSCLFHIWQACHVYLFTNA